MHQTQEDLSEVIRVVLACRAYLNNQEFLIRSGGPHLAAKEILRTFSDSVATRDGAFREVDMPNPDANLAFQFRKN